MGQRPTRQVKARHALGSGGRRRSPAAQQGGGGGRVRAQIGRGWGGLGGARTRSRRSSPEMTNRGRQWSFSRRHQWRLAGYGVDSGRGWAQSSPVRGRGDRGRGEEAVGERNRGAAAEVGRGAGGGAALLGSCARKKRRKRGTRQRGRIRPVTAAADKDARTRNEDRRRVFQGWTSAKTTRGTPRQRNDGPSGPHTRLSGPPNLGS